MATRQQLKDSTAASELRLGDSTELGGESSAKRRLRIILRKALEQPGVHTEVSADRLGPSLHVTWDELLSVYDPADSRFTFLRGFRDAVMMSKQPTREATRNK